jgi:hypothetical protein
LTDRRNRLAEVWVSEIVPTLVAAPGIRAVAVFEELCRRHPAIAMGVRRTLERRIAGWRAFNGPNRDVIFRQEHPPGRMGRRISPTWAGSASPSRASRSSTAYTTSDCRSRASSMLMLCSAARALAEGLQNALWALGGVPEQTSQR